MWPAGKRPGLAHSLLAQARSWASLLFCGFRQVNEPLSVTEHRHTIQRTVLSQCVAEYEGASLGWGLACHRHSTGVCQIETHCHKAQGGLYSSPNH